MRSGKVIDNRVGWQAPGDATNEEESRNQEELHQPHEVEYRATGVSNEKQREGVQEEKEKASEKSKEIDAQTTLPYPQRIGKIKKDKQFLELYSMLSKVQINLPLIEMIENMPLYAKFFKDLCSKKRRLGIQEKVYTTKLTA